MEKIMLTNAEFEIKEGASTAGVAVIADNFADLQGVADALTEPGSLDVVKFKTDSEVKGVYTNMKLENPLFHSVDIENGKVIAAFALREKTEIEMTIEELKAGQEIQDGAIEELGAVISEISEGGVQ